MEIFKLLPSTYLPGTTIQDYETFIWTERFQESGDFELVVEDDISVLTTLPVGTLISHTDTFEVMIVENHNIKRDKNKKLKVTVSGRSFETFGEQRPTWLTESALTSNGTNAIIESITATPQEAARQILSKRLEPAATGGTATANDAVPNLDISLAMRVAGASVTQVIQRGNVYAKALELLKIAKAGFKIVRPNGGQTTLNMILSDGLDKTTTVVFYAQYEDLEDAEYLWSNKNYKNYAQVNTKISARTIRHKDLVSDYTGLDRRMVYVEASDLEANYHSVPLPNDALASRGQTVLDQHKLISLISAKISRTARPKFKVNYDVGDLVTVYGEFAASQVMRVTEHILTSDKQGIIGSPSLSIV